MSISEKPSDSSETQPKTKQSEPKFSEETQEEMPRADECFKCRRTGHNWNKCTFMS